MKIQFFTFFSSFQSSLEEFPKCNATKEYIVFQKTHKASSSTIQNILLRYAMNHDLVVVLPSNNGDNHLRSFL